MKSILIVSTENWAGKSMLAMGIGLTLKERGIPFSYMKPISSNVSYVTGKPIDQDIEAIHSVLGLKDDMDDTAPVALEGPFLLEAIQSGDRGFRKRIVDSFNRVTRECEVALIEGRRFLGLGVGAGLSDFDLAELLDADILMFTRYDGEEAVDRILCALRFLDPGQRLLGVVLNEVSMGSELDLVSDVFVPFLAERGAEVLGIVPYDHRLHYASVTEIVERLGGRLVTEAPLHRPVGHFLIGAMSPELALRGFRRTPDFAVITGGDRVDIQLAALEAPGLRCLILTGNIHPTKTVVDKAEEKKIPVMVVGQDTIPAAELCEQLVGHSCLCRGSRLEIALELIRTNIDIERIIEKAVDR